MKDTYFTLIENKKIASNTYLSVLEGDTSDINASGQFVNIKLDGLYLRRPISVCNVDGDKLTIIYKAVGTGTEKMAATQIGEKWLVLTGLGNGYDLTKSGLLIGMKGSQMNILKHTDHIRKHCSSQMPEKIFSFLYNMPS